MQLGSEVQLEVLILWPLDRILEPEHGQDCGGGWVRESLQTAPQP